MPTKNKEKGPPYMAYYMGKDIEKEKGGTVALKYVADSYSLGGLVF